MKILNLYVTKSFLSTGTLSIVVLTFGMMGVNMIDIFKFVSRGVPLGSACALIIYLMPMALSLTFPVSVLVSVMLVFGRMSADNEITAMRACGISVLQIISPIVIVTFFITCVCLYLQLELSPLFTAKSRLMVKTVGVEHPLAILEPRRTNEYENIHIYIDDRIGENGIKDIQVFVFSNTKKLQQDITATTGRIEVDHRSETMKIILDNAAVVMEDSTDGVKKRTVSKEMCFSINYGKKFNEIKLGEKPNFLTLEELFGMTRFFLREGRDTTKLSVELNKRIALGLSPIAFLLLGLPLAIRTSRKETSINLFLSVILAGVYFISILVFQAIDSKPQYYPQYLLWAPNILYQAGGLYFLSRIVSR